MSRNFVFPKPKKNQGNHMAESHRFFDTYMALRGRIERLVMTIVPARDVEDIVQETYVRVCQIKNKDAVREPRSFLFRTAQNLALDHVKRAESRFTTGVDSIDEIPGSDLALAAGWAEANATYNQAATDEEFVILCEAVRELPKQCRRAFILKKVYGYTLKEIMAEMDIGQPTVETHIVNGTKKCVQYMRERQKQGRSPTLERSQERQSKILTGGDK